MASVRSVWENVSLIAAIKEYRRLFSGSTLKESKDAVEKMAMDGNWQRNLS
jgi:ribosomal protein L7/L12